MSTEPRLIYDIGFHNGDDSAYYLNQGFSVVAVEANPRLVEEGTHRFASEVADGRLTILNLAMWERSDETVIFYVNHTDSGWSSLEAERGKTGGDYQEMSIGTATIATLFERHGVPWYLKIDIEGADEMVIRTLPQSGEVPDYLSFEVNHGCQAIELLEPLGYSGFKLINPVTLTQSLPIFEHELPMRLLRRSSLIAPPFRSLIASLPASIRPRKILWDRPVERLGYRFSDYTTGPFAESTDGSWKTAAEMKKWLAHVYGEYTRAGLSHKFWYDLHARRL